MNKTIIYYTDNRFKYAPILRERILKSAGGIPIVSVSFKPIDFGRNICVGKVKRGPQSIRRQILTALLYAKEGIIYFCEHDVVYPPEHFKFVPPVKHKYYYNRNRWYLRLEDGMASYYRGFRSLSRMVTWREDALEFYLKRKMQKHYEPGINKGDYRPMQFKTEVPVIDIRHKDTITRGDKFVPRRKRRGFRLSESIPHWGTSYKRPKAFINELCNL